MTSERPVVKRTARAILLDGDGAGAGTTPDMIVIKRTKPGRAPYWITPGGGVEPDVDTTVVAALHRELDEELGATVTNVVPAFVDTVPYTEDGTADALRSARHAAQRRHGVVDVPGSDAYDTDAYDADGYGADAGVKVQHFFVCRLVSMDVSRRHGPEVAEPCGDYEIVRIPFSRAGIASVEVVPPTLRAYLDANIEGVRALLAPDLR